jgi:hypothetical protein
MSFVTRRALSTLIPPKVRETESPFGYGRKRPVLRLIPLLTPGFQKIGRFSQGTQNTMILFSTWSFEFDPDDFWMDEI